MKQAVNERVVMLRNYFKMTQLEFSQHLKTSPTNVSRWESGDNVPSKSTLRNISQICECSYNWLYEGTGEMFETGFETKEQIKSFNWKDEAYELLKQQNEMLREEISWLKKLVSQMAGKPNFLKGIEVGGIVSFLNENSFNTVSRVA